MESVMFMQIVCPTTINTVWSSDPVIVSYQNQSLMRWKYDNDQQDLIWYYVNCPWGKCRQKYNYTYFNRNEGQAAEEEYEEDE